MRAAYVLVSIFFLFFLMLIVPVAADTNHIINGDFNQGFDYWDIVRSNSDAAGSSAIVPQTGGVSGAYLSMNAWGGDSTSYGTGRISASQNVGIGDIKTIKFYYKYSGTHTPSGGVYNTRLNVYWKGTTIASITLYPSSGTSWTQVSYPVSSAAPGGELKFELVVQGTTNPRRDFTVGIDNVEVLSVGTAPSISSITAQPSTSSSNPSPAPAYITFTANGVSGDPAPQYLWIFGDGTSQTGYELNTVTHTYTQPGTYTARLVLTNSEGDTETSTTVYVGNSIPATDFYPSPSTGSVPLTVTFILTAAEVGETYQWWFGDGNDPSQAPDSTQAQPVHQYIEQGSYNVRLIVTNSAGSRTIDKPDIITVYNESQPAAGIGEYYPPHSVQMRFLDASTGAPLSGAGVTATYTSSSSPIDWILNWFGSSRQSDLSQVQSGTTGVDGTISWLMYPQLQYTITTTYDGKSMTWNIYPQDTQYLFRMDVGTVTKPTQATARAEFGIEVSEDQSLFDLSVIYSDPSTQQVQFWVKANNQTIYEQSFHSSTMNQSYTVSNTRGIVYTWGYTATQSDGKINTAERGVSGTGAGQPLVDLHFSDVGLGNEWYMYLSFAIMLLVGAVFSQTTAKLGGVVVSLCLGGLFVYFGWLPGIYAGIISFVIVFSVIGYFIYRENNPS